MGLRGLRDLLLKDEGPFLLPDLFANLRDEEDDEDDEDEDPEPDEELEDEEEDDEDEEELELRDRQDSPLGKGTSSSFLGSAGGGLGTLSAFTEAAFEELASGSVREAEGLLEDLSRLFCCVGDVRLGLSCPEDPLV